MPGGLAEWFRHRDEDEGWASKVHAFRPVAGVGTGGAISMSRQVV
jgi:hypothetical protein